ncbi:SMP-30/gluconolactonase/LRE family protein [Cellulomonas shaoxiangyii]|uniref:Superoxide dismutase n=1 Tax=Cellulomonas shaoxiangyii TaxID=2566013 RepID=A0A4P7SPW1_9CELL|nr:SMP-30/gluconolactonase/LRE family protein [Cellulomonas shaoxiangyii]QCB94783.1 superoxide dismutase [Cellulomonas shaoxiangyii]TGY86513.1 superoxide dismutase [Cellulomonas shaoxiangyii]
MRSSLTTTLAAVAAFTLLTAVPASAHDTQGHGHDRHHPDRPTTYLLDPSGPAADDVYPEGVAVRGDDFFVSSTTDGTIYRGDLDEPTATPFLLGGQDGRTSAIGVKVDGRTLLIAGGATGRVWAYDLRTRALTGSWQVVQDGTPAFVNDLAVSPRGDVYVTDSVRPALYRIDAHERRTTGTELLEPFVSFDGTALAYNDGFNVNGIAISRDGRHAVLAQTSTATLFRVGLTDRSVEAIDLGGEPVSGDGLLLDGRRLQVVEWLGDESSIVTVDLDRGYASGTVVSRTSDPSFDDPTTIARAGRSLLVVNSQFGTRAAGGTPEPFTVSRIPVP